MAESSCTGPHTSLRFMPTLQETGLRRNPSTVSNCARKTQSVRTGGYGEAAAYTFLGVLKDERVAAEDGGHENLELHGSEVLTDTPPMIHDDRIVSFLPSGASI